MAMAVHLPCAQAAVGAASSSLFTDNDVASAVHLFRHREGRASGRTRLLSSEMWLGLAPTSSSSNVSVFNLMPQRSLVAVSGVEGAARAVV